MINNNLTSLLPSNCLMGIINITPDSFSDGGELTSVDKLKERVELFNRYGNYVLDIGAESTAPSSAAIDSSTEIRRYNDLFLPLLQSDIKLPKVISIDTYRPETFLHVYKMIKEYRADTVCIWNDVSGVIDTKLMDILVKYKDIYYIFCHSNLRDRFKAKSHMKNLFPESDQFITTVIDFFNLGLEKFSKMNIENRIILDPAFGFSKNYEQNIKLITSLEKVISRFPHNPWLLGISRKSFLKKQVKFETLESNRRVQTEFMHAAMLTKWFNQFENSFIMYRVHDPTLFDACQFSASLIR